MVRYGLVILTIIASLLLACESTPNRTPNQAVGTSVSTRYESSQSPQLAKVIAEGSLKINSITAIAEKIEQSQPFGEIVSISIKNLTNQPQAFRLECGTILRAMAVKYQDLIVIKNLEATIGAQSEWTGKIEVFSLQMRRHYAYKPAEYQLGNLAATDLGRFTQCFCALRPENEKDQKFDLTPVQYAIWHIADNVTLKQLLVYVKGRGNPSIEELDKLEQQIKEQSQYTEQLLTTCRVNAQFID